LEDARERSATRSAPRAPRHFAQVRAYLDAYGVTYTLVPTLVRGLDYYSRTTWEFVGPDESDAGLDDQRGRTLRYLIEEIGGPPTPGCRLRRRHRAAHSRARARRRHRRGAVARRVPRRRRRLADRRARLLAELRARGIAADTDYADRSLKDSSPRAQRTGARAIVIFRDGSITLRRRGEQDVDVQADELLERLAHEQLARHDLRRPDAADAGKRVKIAGWADTRRDHGSLVFIDLRDFSGKVQLVINPERTAAAARRRTGYGSESSSRRRASRAARARRRQPESPHGRGRDPGRHAHVVSRSEPLPFQIGEDVDEVLRLKYRYLDMRSERMQRNLRLSHTVIMAIRRVMDELNFVDIWTPSMTKGTPEGARDFLVAGSPAARQVLRARAVAAALQAALHGRRARPPYYQIAHAGATRSPR